MSTIRRAAAPKASNAAAPSPHGDNGQHAASMLAYRRALREAVSIRDIEDITAMLFHKAMRGDLAAARLILAYATV